MKIKLHWQIIIALGLGAFIGYLVNKGYGIEDENGNFELEGAGQNIAGAFDYIGGLFLRALKMIIVPLIFTSIVVGIAGLGKVKGFGKLGLKTILFYGLSSFLAIVVGLTMVNLIEPGDSPAIRQIIENNSEKFAESVEKKAGEQDTEGFSAITDIFKRMVPQNIFEVLGDNGQMLALIFISLITAFALIYVSETARSSVLPFFEGVNEISLLVTRWIMLFAPIGVLALVGKTVSETGLSIFEDLGAYFLTVLASLGIHFFITLPLLLILVARVSPVRHFKAMRNALITAFSTSSSSATLPVTMRGVHERAGVSNRVTSFVLPLGATVNMDGTALYECVAVIFVFQLMGIEMTFAQQFTVVTLALLTSIGVAGVPSASLVAILIILNNSNLPPETPIAVCVGLLLAIDRPLDMTRTAVNVFSDSCAAVVVGKLEGEDQILTKDPDALDDFD